MATSAAVSRGATGALRVAVYWHERLLDVRALHESERGFARPGAQFEDGGLSLRVFTSTPVDHVPRGWPTRQDLPFLLLVVGLLMSFAFSATLAVQLEPAERPEPSLTRAAATMSRTVFRLPPRVEVLHARSRAADDHEQVRSQKPRSPHRPLEAKNAGLMGALAELGGSPVLENTGLNERIAVSLERLSGAPNADASGFSGINARPGGSGGPGTVLSIGGVGSIPRSANGDSLIALTGLRKAKVDPPRPPPDVRGEGLPRDVVARVIARHQSEIRYCYERALQHTAGLGGKVAVVFTIDATGSVAQVDVAESGLGSPEVESCMTSRIGRWKFPEPKGGGVVSVSYPWVFHQSGTPDE